MCPIFAEGRDVIIHVKVVPGASRTKIAGLLGGRVKILVAAPPEKGKANIALVSYLAKSCGIHKRDVVVESGQSSPLKTVRIRNTELLHVRERLLSGSC